MSNDASADTTLDVGAPALVADVSPTLTDAVAPPTPGTLPIGVAEPRIRWAGIVWGLVLAGMASAGVWFLLSGFGLEGLTPWVMTLTPFTLAVYIVLAFAAIAVIIALVAFIRHAQKTFTARRARL